MQYNDLIELFEASNIPYRTNPIYDEDNNEYNCIWLSGGHIEFYKNGNIRNIVKY